MYRPQHFREDDPAKLNAFIDEHPFAALIAHGESGLDANHLPLMRLAVPDEPLRLIGHIARANTLWRTVADGSPVLIIFAGADHYISPAWYPTKLETGEVVPTWNYLVVHAYGRIQFKQDKEWLRNLVDQLTDRHESGRAAPWKVADAPEKYLDRMLSRIVGIEIAVERLEGKFKASQNRTEAERRGATAGLRAEGLSEEAVSSLVQSKAPSD